MKSLSLLFLLCLGPGLHAQNDFLDKILSDEYQDSLLSHPLGSISRNYTLTLSGWYDDCGEFGGHLETIEIKVKDDRLIAEVIVYKTNCGKKKEPRVKTSKQFQVDDKEMELVVSYLQELQRKTLSYNMSGHAGCRYKARLGFSDVGENNEQFTRLHLSYEDLFCEWTAFQVLKDALKRKW